MKTVLITGASRGIGLALAKKYVDSGAWKVIAACREPAYAAELQNWARGKTAIAVECLDVTDATSIRQLAGNLRGYGIDLLINNAGIGGKGAWQGGEEQAVGTLDYGEFDKLIETNTKGPLRVLEAFLPHLQVAKAPKVIMISSQAGSIGQDFATGVDYTSYSISKAALNMGTRIAAATLKPMGIAVIAMCPGWVSTELGGAGATYTPDQSAAKLKAQIDSFNLKDTGSFINLEGRHLPF